MPLDLPAPDHTPLAHSPLELVVCQIRFEKTASVSDGKKALEFQGALGGPGGPFPTVEPVTGSEVTFMVGAPGLPTPETSTLSGWRFVGANGSSVVSLMPDNVSLETSKYSTWDDFRELLGKVVDATANLIQPAFEQRLGLRYIDRISELSLTKPREWGPYIADELLGLVLHPALGERVQVAQQQLVLEIDADVRCGLRHGFISDPGGQEALDYLFDFDLYRQGGRAFEPEAIKATADQLNEYGLQLFQAAITPELLDRLR